MGADEVARVWGSDSEGGWAGAPDIIAVANGKLTLADLKTSVKPYSGLAEDLKGQRMA